MTKQYINEDNLQIAMAEYNTNMGIGRIAKTPNGHRLGTVTRVYDNTSGDGGQVYFMLYYK